ncbi:MAG: hypothetical protein U1E42_12125 [Rhodospirillales bacterium]
MQLAIASGTTTEATYAADAKEDWHELPIGNLRALLKAGDIWARGVRMLNTACLGSLLMGIDDSIAELQARMSCGSLSNLVKLEADITSRALSRTFARFCVLGRMTGQLTDDALVPLQRRVGAVFDSVSKLAA